MSLQLAAQHMASRGRGPDTTLVHMAPQEVASLQAIAKANGGTLTTNPDTGLPEAGFLSKLLPAIAGFALAPLTAGTSLAFLGATPLASAMTVGGLSGLATGSLKKGLMAGLGAYGGASLGGGLAGAGTAELGKTAVTSATEEAARQGLTGEAYNTAVQNSVANQMGGLSSLDKLSAGFNNPSAMVKVVFHDGGIYAEEMLYETKLTTNDLVERVKNLGISAYDEIFCDSAEPKTIEELVRNGFNAKPSNKDVFVGIQKIKSLPFFVLDTSANLIKELKNYKWKTDKNGKRLDEPVIFI